MGHEQRSWPCATLVTLAFFPMLWGASEEAMAVRDGSAAERRVTQGALARDLGVDAARDDAGAGPGRPRPPELVTRSRAAVALPAQVRDVIVRRFFSRHPHGAAPLGLGRAVVDFMDWEVRSGRLVDAKGSDWWRCTNGVMMLDLLAAERAIEHGHETRGAVAAWVGYALGDAPSAQARLWAAHRASLAAGLELANPLLAPEPVAERQFAEIVVAVVERVAADVAPTDTDDLAAFTERHYPARYPARGDEVASLRREVAAMLARPMGHSGSR